MKDTIQSERIKLLNNNDIQDGKYVLYWMQASHRAECNHALEFAIEKANKLNRPLIVYFTLIPNFPSANVRSYFFMLQGLREVSKSLEARNIEFQMTIGHPLDEVRKLSKESSLILVDRDYQRMQRHWRKQIAASVNCPVIQVETNVIIPVEIAYHKEAYSAGILRPQIQSNLEQFLKPLSERRVDKTSNYIQESIDLNEIQNVLELLAADANVSKVNHISGGTTEAKYLLSEFIKNRLSEFHLLRNDPSKDYPSNMSPYLHFGQISPLYIALEIKKSPGEGAESYLEELIVRRELSMNFVYYNPNYDSIECLPAWAKTTLQDHANDPREYIYTRKQLENAETHDQYWNAAQTEMMQTGKMHGYMRMYWGKKILEWSKNPESAYKNALYLNDKYELDGRDPNGYAGVSWCFGKHDRAWAERPIFGKVRYMNAKGLERKFDMDKYVQKIRI
jgi:deoxyribodipyrimidine photo-lyase